MPAALTHYLFALQNKENIKDVDAFLLGTQGPDPFFFFGMVPWRKKAEPAKIQGYAEELHHSDFSLIYARMIAYANSQKGELQDTLLDYLKGAWAHYCLDRVCHPYVFYRSGFDENGQLKGHYGYAHKVFEALLDATLKKKHKLPSPSRAMKIPQKKGMEISKMWQTGSPDFLNEDTFYESLRDYRSVESFLQSKTGCKRILWKMLGKENVLYAFSYPVFLKGKEGLDALNAQKKEWRNPVTGIPSNLSVDEMFYEAKKLYLKGVKVILEAKNIENTSTSLSNLERGIDHDGCLYGKKKVYLDESSPF